VNLGAEEAGAALLHSAAGLVDALPGGWAEPVRGALGIYSGIELPTLNGVWVGGREPARRDDVDRLLTRLPDTGVPHCLQFGASGSPMSADLIELATARGMARAQDVPLMLLDDPTGLDEVTSNAPLVIRRLASDEGALHVEVAAAGFEAPRRVFEQMMPPPVMELPDLSCYLAESEGRPVCTGVGYRVADSIGVFSIATPPAERRKGYAAAITARIILDAFADGANWAWLQSSPDGYPVYRRLGFRTVAEWECWLAIS
jgi:hypothetical protein